MKELKKCLKRGCGVAVCLLITVSAPTLAQSSGAVSQTDAVAEASIDAKISALSTSLDETRAELAESREEIKQLRTLLERVSEKLDSTATTEETAASASVSAQAPDTSELPGAEAQAQPVQNAARITQDDWEVLNSRVEQLQQTKVESGSKFPIRLSGMFLMNTLINSGRLDSVDAPTIAIASTNGSGSTGISLRQSIIGVEGTGARFLDANISADLQADFFGGTPSGYGPSALGLMRLRLARMRMDWDHTSIIGGVDTPFFSPHAPTSYLTVAEPAFSAAGNLWTWSPVIRVEQRFDTGVAQFKAEAGLVDVPSYVASTAGTRLPSPGEASRQPAYALRLSANGQNEERPMVLGLSGIYLTQRFPNGTTIAGGGGMADWNLSIFPHAELSGELFAGKGLDGFGGAPVPAVTTQDYIQYITSTAPDLARIGEFGGWSQLKFRVNSRSEFNVAAGGVGRDANAFRQAALADSIIQTLPFKNESLMFNYAYRPRSDLVFSAEYRRFRTYQLPGTHADAGQTGLTAGFIF